MAKTESAKVESIVSGEAKVVSDRRHGGVHVFVATRASDAPCAAYVSVDGVVPGCLVAWDHHTTGERTNMDALPGRVDFGEIAREFGVERVEGVGTTWADADAVASAVAVLCGGPDALAVGVRGVLASASHWCDHLTPHPDVDKETNESGRGLAEWIAQALRSRGPSSFAEAVWAILKCIEEDAPLPTASPDPLVESNVLRLLDGGGLSFEAGIAVIDQSSFETIPPARLHALHDRPVSVMVYRHNDGGRKYVVGVNPSVEHPTDLSSALAAIAREEFAHGPPVLLERPGPGSENWGGRATVFGSPWNYGSRLAPEEVARLVAAHLPEQFRGGSE